MANKNVTPPGMTRRAGLAAAALGVATAAVGGRPARAQSTEALGLDAEVFAAARREREFTLYTAQSREVVDETVNAFRRAIPGIEVRSLRLATGPLSSRFAQEAGAGVHQADLVNFAGTRLFTGQPQWWRPLTAAEIPTLRDWPAGQLHPNYLNTTQGPQLIVYNKNLVRAADVPKTWEDVLKPVFRNRLLLVDPRSSNNYMAWTNLMFETYGESFLTGLRQQGFRLVEGGSQGAQQVAAGASHIVFPPSFAHAEPLIQRGAPLAVAYPSDNSPVPAIGPQHSWGLPRTSPKPNAARVFLTWLLTEQAQKINCGGNAASVLLTNFEGCPRPAANFISADQDISTDRAAMLLGLLGLR